MSAKKAYSIIIIFIFTGLIAWAIYNVIIPEKIYNGEQKLPLIEIILAEKPFFHYIGLDQPYYYNLAAKNYPNSFRISGFVLDLVQDNDSVSSVIKKLNSGDTISINIDTLAFVKLNKGSANVEILGLGTKNKVVIDTGAVGKYQRKSILDRRFSYFVIALVLFFIFWKQIRLKRKTEI
jgi:hypothetical protein